MTNLTTTAQNTMSPELLWKLGRVSTLGISVDAKNILYKVDFPSVEENKSNSKFYSLPINGGTPTEVADTKNLLKDKNISPDGKYIVYNEEVKIDKVHGKDF
ncbi:MAG: S9 family peptidase, partial [Flavobacterium sp.]|nr:S9 family peptidase [Flavobacterium sp.]